MKTIVCLSIVVFYTALQAQTESVKYRVIDKDSTGNIIFASQKIPVGGEDSVKIKDAFALGEQIWGRAYFQDVYENYQVSAEDVFYLELYIDDHLVQKVLQEHPEDDWGQMQVWIAGTGNDYFSEFERSLENVAKGEHKVNIIIGIGRYIGDVDFGLDPNSRKKKIQKQYHFIIISKGSFIIIKS